MLDRMKDVLKSDMNWAMKVLRIIWAMIGLVILILLFPIIVVIILIGDKFDRRISAKVYYMIDKAQEFFG